MLIYLFINDVFTKSLRMTNNYFDHIYPLFQRLSFPSLHSHPPNSCSLQPSPYPISFCPVLFLQASSPVCIVWLLGLGPTLQCGPYRRGHTLKENCTSSFQQQSDANNNSSKCGTCYLPLLHARVFPSLSLYYFCA